MHALIVDDSRSMRAILRRIVGSLDFDVTEAADGLLGIAALEAGPLPEIVLVDWNMPNMDGLEFITEVRSRPHWRQITLMMVTTESEHNQIVRALAAGAHEYVMKPFTADAIVEKFELLGLLPSGVTR